MLLTSQRASERIFSLGADSFVSSYTTLSCGVPQGCVLGLFCFVCIIFTTTRAPLKGSYIIDMQMIFNYTFLFLVRMLQKYPSFKTVLYCNSLYIDLIKSCLAPLLQNAAVRLFTRSSNYSGNYPFFSSKFS